MGFFLKFWALILGVIMAFFFPTGTHKSYEPEKVDINGVVYKNCFIPEYATFHNIKDEKGNDKVSFGDSEAFFIDKEGTRWFKLTDDIVLKGSKLYSSLNREGTLYYCPESEWNTKRAYYYDMNNWNCSMEKSMVVGQNADGSYKISVIEKEYDSVDSEHWNEMIHFIACYENYDVKKVVIDYSDAKCRAIFDMTSKDGLFNIYSNYVYYVNGDYYVEITSMGPQMDSVKVPDSLKPYLNELIEG